jgi:hypothetical protein
MLPPISPNLIAAAAVICCWFHQQNNSWFRAPSVHMPIFLFVPRTLVFWNGACSSTRGGGRLLLPTIAELLSDCAVICYWPSPAQSFLVSAPIETHAYISVRSKTSCILKWNLLFVEMRGPTTAAEYRRLSAILTALQWFAAGPRQPCQPWCSPIWHIYVQLFKSDTYMAY